MLLLALSALSIIPVIDIKVTTFINSFKIQQYTGYFSNKIIYFNLLTNLFLLFRYQNYLVLLLRCFTELIIINFCFKGLLDRPRPKYSLLKNNTCNKNKYISIFNLKISKDWTKNKSFPSGHVATIYCTYYIINNYYIKLLYFVLLILTIISRINLASHYFSDCIIAMFIYNLCIIFYNNFINFNTFEGF